MLGYGWPLVVRVVLFAQAVRLMFRGPQQHRELPKSHNHYA